MSSNFVLLSPALSPDALPLNQTRRRDRTGRLLILILIVILLGLGSWRLRVRLRLRLGRNHSALIQWQCTPALSPRRGGSTHSSRNFHAFGVELLHGDSRQLLQCRGSMREIFFG